MSGTLRSQLDRGAITIKDGDTFLSMPPGHDANRSSHAQLPGGQLSPGAAFDNDFFMQPPPMYP